MRSLALRWRNLHTSYYKRISEREDVIYLQQLLPFALLCYASPNIYNVFTDMSHANENAVSDCGWVDVACVDGDLVESNTGAGIRLNIMSFMDDSGILAHPDGDPACTLFKKGSKQGHEDFLEALKRGIEAIKASPRFS